MNHDNYRMSREWARLGVEEPKRRYKELEIGLQRDLDALAANTRLIADLLTDSRAWRRRLWLDRDVLGELAHEEAARLAASPMIRTAHRNRRGYTIKVKTRAAHLSSIELMVDLYSRTIDPIGDAADQDALQAILDEPGVKSAISILTAGGRVDLAASLVAAAAQCVPHPENDDESLSAAYAASRQRALRKRLDSSERRLAWLRSRTSVLAAEIALSRKALERMQREGLPASDSFQYFRLLRLPHLKELKVSAEERRVDVLTDTIVLPDNEGIPRRIGAFDVAIDLSAGRMTLRNHDRQLAKAMGDVDHPHVLSGVGCYGDFGAYIHDAFLVGDIGELTRLSIAFLDSYNRHSTYADASKWPMVEKEEK